MDELYLENIDEYVTDQNKIVTYKWLSLTLGVHVNQAKQMLYDYVERKRKDNAGAQLHVTYLVTGKHLQNGYSFHKVAVVKEEKLEAVKSKLAVVSSVHVYSIQKAVLKDSGPLFSTDYDIIKANLDICSKFSAIQCDFVVRRAPSEISRSQTGSQESSEQQTSSVPIANGHGPPPSSKATSKTPKGIMGMFGAKPSSKPQTTSNNSKPDVKESPASAASSKSTAKANAVNNFFGKASMKKKASSELEQMVKEEKPAAQPIIPEPETEVAMTAEKSVEKPEEEPVEKPVETQPASKTNSEVQQKKGKKSKVKRSDVSDSDDEKTTKKKRRRIKKPVSESSDDEASLAAQEEQPPSPPPSPEPALKVEPESQPIANTEKKRKRRRVLKSNTFMDEEGCIVTEKKYESESCTDSESESSKAKLPTAPKKSAPAVKHESKASKKAAAAPSKGVKQASIMGFFQKK
ncbi:DNA polymerase delta subunit 3 [Ambystoma mexicanum]|uniref:DNA polymerase delta subunit 3 n=1 Tax=Ambystoma mexicanum TaxID=8296 RepID=UPI0037E8B556